MFRRSRYYASVKSADIVNLPLVAIIHELCRKFDVRLIAFVDFIGFALILMWIGHFDKSGYYPSQAARGAPQGRHDGSP